MCTNSRSLPVIDLIEIALDVLLDIARDLLIREGVGGVARASDNLGLDVDEALAFDGLG